MHCFVPPRAAAPGPSASHHRHRALSWRQPLCTIVLAPSASLSQHRSTGAFRRQPGLSAGEGRQYLHADRAGRPILAQHTAFLGAPAINN